MPIVARVVASVVALVSFAFAAFTIMTPAQLHSTYVSPPSAIHALPAATSGAVIDPPAVLFVGDSYTAGSPGISSAQTFPNHVCFALGLVCNFDAQGSTGYQANGHELSKSNKPFGQRLHHDTTMYQADLVVVSGGGNDVGQKGSEQLAVRKYLSDLHKAYPQARIVVLEPFWSTDHPPLPMQRVRQAVKLQAKAAGVTYLPTDGWLSTGAVAGDGVDPDLEGHRELAAHLISALRASGVLEMLGSR